MGGRRLNNYCYRPKFPCKTRRECKRNPEWIKHADYPVLAANVFAYSISSLRKNWFLWLNYTERKKEAIRKINIYYLKVFSNSQIKKIETTKIIKK